jgi:hypothetical protein
MTEKSPVCNLLFGKCNVCPFQSGTSLLGKEIARNTNFTGNGIGQGLE